MAQHKQLGKRFQRIQHLVVIDNYAALINTEIRNSTEITGFC